MQENSNIFRRRCKKILQHHLLCCFKDIISEYEKSQTFSQEIIIKFIPTSRLLKHHNINRRILQKDGSMTVILKRDHGNNLTIQEDCFRIDIKVGNVIHKDFAVGYSQIVAIVIPCCDFYIDLGESFKEVNLKTTLAEENIILHDFTSNQE